ncbi:MAG: HD domain-containing protein [Planctomycetota bacterium]|nr:HD domain-containing protein [Planctomycetota bacterium]
MKPVSWQIRKRWLLVVLIAAGQLAVLLPCSLWLAGWLKLATEDIVEQRLNVATMRHTRQMADLINDLGPIDLRDGSDDRADLQQLIDRMGRPYGAALVIIRQSDGLVLAQPRELGLYFLTKEALSKYGGESPPENGASPGNGAPQDNATNPGDSSSSDGPIAVRMLTPLGISLVALPHRGDVANIVLRFDAYIRWTIIAMLLVIVASSTILTTFIVQRYENRLAGENVNLERQVATRSRALVKSRDAVIFGLAMLAESRDGETGLHLERIQAYVRLLGDELIQTHPEVDEEFVTTIESTSALHDIGKVGVPDRILLSPDKLTDEERAFIKKHPLIGFDTIFAVKRRWGDDQFLVTACEICVAHHERWDGKGYPFGHVGDIIPLSARIVALADVYDALTTQRVYKDALPHDHAKQYITDEAGGHFDPEIVEAFLRCESKFQEVLESSLRS